MGYGYIFVDARRDGCAKRLIRLWGLSYSIGTIRKDYTLSLGSDTLRLERPQGRGKRLAPWRAVPRCNIRESASAC